MQKKRALNFAIGVCLLVIMAFFLIWLIQPIANGLSSVDTDNKVCIPTPLAPTPDLRLRTSTPDLVSVAKLTVTPPASVTPLPIKRTIDLAPELPSENKLTVLVWRCDGSIDLYLAEPSVEDISFKFELQKGDVVMDILPPAATFGNQPPPLSGLQAPTPIGIPTGYPVLTQPFFTLTPLPYPAAIPTISTSGAPVIAP